MLCIERTTKKKGYRIDRKEIDMAEYILEMFVVSLLLTLAIELVVLFLLREHSKRNVILLLLVNVLTNPVAVFLAWIGNIFGGFGKNVWFQLPIEIVVVLVEAGIYWIFSKEKEWEIRHPIRLAVVANAVSWLLGVMVQLFR